MVSTQAFSATSDIINVADEAVARRRHHDFGARLLEMRRLLVGLISLGKRSCRNCDFSVVHEFGSKLDFQRQKFDKTKRCISTASTTSVRVCHLLVLIAQRMPFSLSCMGFLFARLGQPFYKPTDERRLPTLLVSLADLRKTPNRLCGGHRFRCSSLSTVCIAIQYSVLQLYGPSHPGGDDGNLC